MAISGTVTRSSQVRPELLRGTFTCLECGTDNKNIQQQFKYTEPKVHTDHSFKCTGFVLKIIRTAV
jgi:DNA replication licensing factor MCM6